MLVVFERFDATSGRLKNIFASESFFVFNSARIGKILEELLNSVGRNDLILFIVARSMNEFQNQSRCTPQIQAHNKTQSISSRTLPVKTDIRN